MNMKRMNRIAAIFLVLLLAVSAAGCGGTKKPAVTETPAPAAATPEPKVASVERYNRTGKIQREDFYTYDSGTPQISHSIEYAYTDSGRLSTVRKNGGGLGENKAIESYLYNGDNCTQRIIYDSNGSTETVYYWTYRKNVLTSERVVRMIPAENGFSYIGKEETVTEYNEDGTAKKTTRSAPDDYEMDEYEYDDLGRLREDVYSHSSDGKTYRVFETRSYSYDENGKLRQQTNRDALGQITLCEILEYNEAGDILTDTTYSSGEIKDDNITLRKVYEYANGGLLNSLTEYQGMETTQTFYEYNAAGENTVITVVKTTGDRPPEKMMTETEYDSRSNPVKRTVRRSDGSETIDFFCAYEYYDDGKIMNKINYAV